MWKAKEDVVWRKKEDMLVLLKTTTGHYYTVNQIGASLWVNHIDRGLPFDESVGIICDACEDAPERSVVEADCAKLIEEWKSEKLIEDGPTQD